MNRRLQIISVSFDAFPSPKGAATHIEAFANGLKEIGDLTLVTLPPPEGFADASHSLRGFEHCTIDARGSNFLDRVRDFRESLGSWFKRREKVDFIHFRSIFEGYPIARRKKLLASRLVYEVNALPSIELKYHYPAVGEDREIVKKLKYQEQYCLDHSDIVITPSRVTRDFLVKHYNVDPRIIHVVPNGVDVDLFEPAPSPWSGASGIPTFLYSGTISPWQGVDTALTAFKRALRQVESRLILVGPIRNRMKRSFFRYVGELGLSEHVHWAGPVGKRELVQLHHQSVATLAPLKDNDRNSLQGCCPLKILESMACGIPVIASDLPVVRELIPETSAGILIPPNDIKGWSRAMAQFAEHNSQSWTRISVNARNRVEKHFTWDIARRGLINAYSESYSIPSTPTA